MNIKDRWGGDERGSIWEYYFITIMKVCKPQVVEELFISSACLACIDFH